MPLKMYFTCVLLIPKAYAKPLRELIGTKNVLMEQKDYDLIFSDLIVIRGFGKRLLKQVLLFIQRVTSFF
jgi:hypothetical protein